MALEELVAQRGHLVVDGAMGTEMFARGLLPGDAPERMNVDVPKKVQEVHQAYVDAGSDIFLTNSFGGTRHRLSLHTLDDRVVEVNEAAGRNGRVVADLAGRAGRNVLVAGSVGPTGELIAPLGPLEFADAVVAFAEQAEGLSRGGVDLVWIETMSSLEEVEAAVRGTRQRCDLPIAVTMSFDTAGRTMMGVTGDDAAKRLTELGVAAMGANCGNNLADTEAAVLEMQAVSGVPVISKANAGIPQWRGAGAVLQRHPRGHGRSRPSRAPSGRADYRWLLWEYTSASVVDQRRPRRHDCGARTSRTELPGEPPESNCPR